MKIFGGGSKESTEMERVLQNISQAESDIQQRIYQLGQLYYEQNKENVDVAQPYGSIVDIINKLEQNKIKFYKNKLRLEGQMMCENCGTLLPYGSVFCSHCGKRADEKQESAKQTQTADNDLIKCAKCGAMLEKDSLFCVICGAKVSSIGEKTDVL